MIEQLQFSLRTAETPRLPSAWAYRIYGWLMSQLPADTAARLHEQGEHLLSQSLCFDAAAQTSVWTLNLLDEVLAAQVRPLLAGCTTLKLHGAPLQMEPLGSHSVENGLQLLLAAREEPASRTRLWFRTPCAFKQAGRYAIYPQEFLLLQSLVLHWNTAFPDFQLNDPDALDAILRGLHILDYNLHTVSYPIKNTRIPVGWDPRAKQSHAMALFTAFHAAALFKSRLRQTKKQTHKRVSAFFGRSSGI